MPTITLPDGSEKAFGEPVTGFDIAASIGPGLAKAALAMKVDGEQKDLSTTLSDDARVSLLTAKDAEGLDVLRHTLAAQVLARAVKELYPDAKLAIGPTVEHGFYYDVALPAGKTLHPDDLEPIEQRMREIIKQGLPVTRELHPRDDAIAYFEAKGEPYKADIIRRAPAEETEISLYRQGAGGEDVFTDLCYGPHLPNLAKAGTAFKLTTLAGAYWRGDSDNEMLTRIYGTAWPDDRRLKAHLRMLEEAAARDHRRLGKQLDLFHMQEAAPGMVFWHPRGWTLWQTIEQYLRGELREAGYQEIRTPQIADRSLWERSGHWENYHEHMFVTESEKRLYALKPMNCPCHVEVYKQNLHSYRDLPLRLAEFGACHRNEFSGALHGLMRVRGFVQDDAHIFCTEDQVVGEVTEFNRLLLKVYADFGFTDVDVKLALRPEKRVGSDADWQRAEDGLREALRASSMDWQELPDEGAFYGPKIEYHLNDTLGRSWQCGTMQLDFMLPERLDAGYVDEHSERRRPVMLHRAIFGSLERFIGILIENYAGHFPLWLAPRQAVVMGITERQNDAVQTLCERLLRRGLRAEADLRNEKVSYKIREHSLQKVPLQLVLGDREIANGTVSVRRLGSKDQTTLPVDELVAALEDEIRLRKLPEHAG